MIEATGLPNHVKGLDLEACNNLSCLHGHAPISEGDDMTALPFP